MGEDVAKSGFKDLATCLPLTPEQHSILSSNAEQICMWCEHKHLENKPSIYATLFYILCRCVWFNMYEIIYLL